MDNQNCKSECPIKGCLGKVLGAAIVVFILLNACGFVINHVWLMPIYRATAPLWRPMEQMESMMPLMEAYFAVQALVIAALFCKVKKGKMACIEAKGEQAECKVGGKHCPIKLGVCFGALLGVLTGTLEAGNYIWMPIPLELAQKWFIGNLAQGIIIGVALALLCHACKKKACKA